MANDDISNEDTSIQERLIKAAMHFFLNDDYHRVTTRKIAAEANANISMIRYYFGNKEGLYEEMIRRTLLPMINSIDSISMSSSEGIADFFKTYYRTMTSNPQFPALILKVLALNQGPGKRFIFQLLERGRTRANAMVKDLKVQGNTSLPLDPDVLRISLVSLAMMPMLAKNIFEEQLENEIDEDFLNRLADFNGQLLSKCLIP